MSAGTNLKRFLDAQENSYPGALSEIQRGRKRSHWMWYIFPQIQGLGRSETSAYYAIKDLKEAESFLNHPVLGGRLIQISAELLHVQSNSAKDVFGSPDDLKLKSSMTLFASLHDTRPVFQSVLDKFFNGLKDSRTVALLKNQS